MAKENPPHHIPKQYRPSSSLPTVPIRLCPSSSVQSLGLQYTDILAVIHCYYAVKPSLDLSSQRRDRFDNGPWFSGTPNKSLQRRNTVGKLGDSRDKVET